MKRLAIVLFGMSLASCTHSGAQLKDEQAQEYSAVAITLSDFSMKVVAYYQLKHLPIPNDFDSQKLLALLHEIYPDQARVKRIEDRYRLSARPLDGGYSVMLCNPKTGRKIMEDLSCHLNRVEIQSWQNDVSAPCAFEANWKHYCE